MNRIRNRPSIKRPSGGCSLCDSSEHGTYQHAVAMADAPEIAAELDPSDPRAFSDGYRLGALVAGGIALSCAALAIAAQFLR